jgi:hypothetical protein
MEVKRKGGTAKSPPPTALGSLAAQIGHACAALHLPRANNMARACSWSKRRGSRKLSFNGPMGGAVCVEQDHGSIAEPPRGPFSELGHAPQCGAFDRRAETPADAFRCPAPGDLAKISVSSPPAGRRGRLQTRRGRGQLDPTGGISTPRDAPLTRAAPLDLWRPAPCPLCPRPGPAPPAPSRPLYLST